MLPSARGMQLTRRGRANRRQNIRQTSYLRQSCCRNRFCLGGARHGQFDSTPSLPCCPHLQTEQYTAVEAAAVDLPARFAAAVAKAELQATPQPSAAAVAEVAAKAPTPKAEQRACPGRIAVRPSRRSSKSALSSVRDFRFFRQRCGCHALALASGPVARSSVCGGGLRATDSGESFQSPRCGPRCMPHVL